MSEPTGDEPQQNPFAGLGPLGGMLGGAGGSGDLGAVLHQLGDLLSGQSGPVNWRLAEQSAVQAAGVGDPGTSNADETMVADAMRLADLWLDPATTMPSGVSATEAWSRRRWVQATLPAWQRLCDPVVARVVEAMGSALPPEIRGAAGPVIDVIRQLGGVLFGAQVGESLGKLAAEVVSSTDVGLPLGPPGRAALLPANVAEFGSGLGVPAEEVRLFLALREAAHHRLFGHVPWLAGHLIEAVEAFARGIRVDVEALESAMRQVDPQDTESLQRALAGGMFEPQTTPEQAAALARLETALALVEGWVDDVVGTVAGEHLPSSAALQETVRRRRASGGPAEQAFGALVGLELRPRRLREAAALWRLLREQDGIAARDAVWSHPDLLPSPDDLDDPEAFVARLRETPALAPPDDESDESDEG